MNNVVLAGEKALDHVADLTSARVIALGGSGVAGISDLYSAPMGLAGSGNKKLVTSYEQALAERTTYTLGYSVPYDVFTQAGFGLTFSRIGDIPVTEWDENDRPKTTDTFSDEKLGILFSVSRALSSDLSFSGGLKYYRHVLYLENAQGVGVDAGLRWKVSEQFSLAAMIHNIGDTRLLWTTGTVDTIGQEFITGAAYRCSVFGLRSQFLADLAWGSPEPKFYAGLEAWLSDMFALRIGSRAGTMTAGLGLEIESFSLDYAYEFEKIELGSGQKVMLGYVF